MAAEKKKSKQVKDVSALVKFFFTLGVLAILLFIGVFVYERINNTPRAVVDEYVDGFMAKSPSRLFRTLNLKNTRFITPDRLDTLLKDIAEYDKITSYSLVKEEEKGNRCIYRINYMTGRIQSPCSQVLTLKQSDEDYLLFQKKWAIDGSDLLAGHVTFRVPLDATIKVDDVELTDELLRKKAELYKDFEPGDMFIGEHTYEVKLDGFKPCKGTFKLESKDYGGEPVVDVSTSNMKPDGESQNIVKKLIARIVPMLYEAMLQRRSYDYFLQEVAVESTTKEGFRGSYESMVKDHINSRTHLTYVNFGEFVSKVHSTIASDDCYALRVDTTVPYAATSTVVADEENPELRTKQGTLKIRSVFHYSEGQWWLYDSDAFRVFVEYIGE